MMDIKVIKKLHAAGGTTDLDVCLNIEKGDFVALYGDSGVGKTSTLRMLSGLMQPDSGHIKVDGQIWFDDKSSTKIDVQHRKIGFVFQDYALFPNMTVKENLEFALPKSQNRSIVDELIALIELEELQNQKPDILSGGQKQRVALARALVQKPEILLLDEPFSALDHNMKIKLQDYLLKTHKEQNMTTVLVSHDIAQITRLANKVFVLADGKITDQGTPQSVFKKVKGKSDLTGCLMSTEEIEGKWFANILVGSEIVTVTMEAGQLEKYAIGDEIMVSLENASVSTKP